MGRYKQGKINIFKKKCIWLVDKAIGFITSWRNEIVEYRAKAQVFSSSIAGVRVRMHSGWINNNNFIV